MKIENTYVIDEKLINFQLNNIIKNSIDDINKLIIKDTQELMIRNLLNRIDKATEILKLCNSQCAKETIEILKGGNDE